MELNEPNEPINIIFLDFDGVIHSVNEKHTNEFNRISYIEHIVKNTNAKIVISSDWRFVYTLDAIKKHLLPSLMDYIIDETPFININISRETEISLFLKETSHNIKNYVIIDDIKVCEKESSMFSNFVRTNGHIGITEDDVNKIMRILQG